MYSSVKLEAESACPSLPQGLINGAKIVRTQTEEYVLYMIVRVP